MKRYEVLLALDIRGKEDTIKDTIERLEKLFKAEGTTIEQVQRLEKRELSYESGHAKSAYYVNFVFTAAPVTIEKLRQKLKLDDDVLLQNYLQLTSKKKQTVSATK